LLHAERDTLGFRVDLDDLDFDFLTDFNHLRRVIDTLVGHVGDVQQAIDAAKVDERTVVGDVLDDTLADVAFGHVGHDFRTLFGAALFKDGAARDNDVAARAVQLENGEGLNFAHERADIADRADVHLGARKEGVDAAEVDREAAFDAAGDRTFDRFVVVEALFELDPALFAAGLVTGQDGVAKGVFDTVEIDVDDVAGFRLVVFHREFAKRNTAFGFQADVDEHGIVFNADNGGRDNLAFLHCRRRSRRFEHGSEIVGGGVH
jgi:hypothetical protein